MRKIDFKCYGVSKNKDFQIIRKGFPAEEAFGLGTKSIWQSGYRRVRKGNMVTGIDAPKQSNEHP